MGTSTSGAEFAGKIRRAGSNLKAAEKSAVQSGGQVAQRVFSSTQSSMHAAKSTAPVRVRNTESDGHAAVAVGWRNPGWVAILEGRVGPHFIAPKGRGRGASLRRQGAGKSARATRMAVLSLFPGQQVGGGGGRAAIGIPGIGPRAYAHHPGIHKKKPFVQVAMKAAPPLVKREMALKATTAFAQPFK